MSSNTTNADLISRMVERLKLCKPDDIVTSEEIKKVLGEKRYLLYPAMKAAVADNGVSFISISRVGYKCISVEIAPAAHGAKARKAAKNRLKAGMYTISHSITKSNSVSNEAILRGAAELSVMGLAVQQLHESAVSAKQSEIVIKHNNNSSNAARDSLERMRAKLGRTR